MNKNKRIKQKVVNRLLVIDEITEYHIFADNIDDYRDTYDDALLIYNQLCKDYANVRLYVQIIDETGDVMEENCLKAKGGFPN